MAKPFSKKDILLIFAGGTALVERGRALREVRTAHDMQPWLERIPELALIANVTPRFFAAGSAFDVAPAWWQQLATLVRKEWKKYDGFIITQPIDAIPYTAAALSLMLQDVGKPALVTGSPEASFSSQKKQAASDASSAFSVRTNLINAVQVASQDVGGVSVVFGNVLFHGGTVVRKAEPSFNAFESAGGQPLARVDFGLKVRSSRPSPAVRLPKLFLGLKERVVQVALQPGGTAGLPPLGDKKIDGVLMSGQLFTAPDEAVALVRRSLPNASVPIAVASHWPMPRSSKYFTVTRVTQTMAYVKFMWALGQSSSPARIQQLLDTDVAGERMNEPR